MLLDEVQVTNLLVESCKIYMASELFITELECLAYFNHHVTFPYLNCVEVSSQEELLKIMPQLYKDLLMNKVDTLNKFVVKISGISTPTLTSETAEMVVKEMCQDAAEILKLQCGKEYGFSSDPQRATDTHRSNKILNKSLFRLNKISYEEMLENLIILLDGEKHESTATVANLPTNKTVLDSMSENSKLKKQEAPVPVKLINTMCVVVWSDGASYSWYLGYIKKEHCENRDTYEVDHLSRIVRSSDTKWKYPSTPDVQQVHREQIIKCDIVGQWDMNADSRTRVYILYSEFDFFLNVYFQNPYFFLDFCVFSRTCKP
jgi:hypothetical protein